MPHVIKTAGILGWHLTVPLCNILSIISRQWLFGWNRFTAFFFKRATWHSSAHVSKKELWHRGHMKRLLNSLNGFVLPFFLFLENDLECTTNIQLVFFSVQYYFGHSVTAGLWAHWCHALLPVLTHGLQEILKALLPSEAPFSSDASAVSTVNACAAQLPLDQPIKLCSWSSA